jgi:CHAP domain
MSRGRQSASAGRAALVLERLLVDPQFRARFRAAPAATLERCGMADVANGLRGDGRALQTLDMRESRSSLAGVLMAAAVEGIGLLDDIAASPRLQPDAAEAVRQTLARPAVRRMTTVRPAAAPRTGAIAAASREAPARDTSPEAARDATAAPRSAVSGGAVAYPGDGAPREAIAAWMGAAAERAGLPPELPIMAALQESTLRNLDGGHADSVGFFQMRLSYWNQGSYAGYPDRPELQMRWFIDHALAEREKNPGLAQSPETWGEWIANVERPAEEYRGLYQRHLPEARRLLRAGSGSAPAADAEPAARAPRRAPAARTAVAPAAHRGARTGVRRVVEDADDAVRGDGGPPLPRRMLRIAAKEIGQQEHPPGSNDSERIAHYRTATPGGPVGPWCAYFVSWVAHQAGVPLGDQEQGFASVDALWGWAQESGKAVPAGKPPRPGDLIVWDEHVGIVERVHPDGTIDTIEGNTTDQVARRQHSPDGVVGYVRLS